MNNIVMTNNKWDEILNEEYHKDYFKNIVAFVNKVYKEKVIFPPKNRILSALDITDYDKVKVVILGQDPYHGIGVLPSRLMMELKFHHHLKIFIKSYMMT